MLECLQRLISADCSKKKLRKPLRETFAQFTRILPEISPIPREFVGRVVNNAPIDQPRRASASFVDNVTTCIKSNDTVCDTASVFLSHDHGDSASLWHCA